MILNFNWSSEWALNAENFLIYEQKTLKFYCNFLIFKVQVPNNGVNIVLMPKPNYIHNWTNKDNWIKQRNYELSMTLLHYNTLWYFFPFFDPDWKQTAG